MKKEYYSIIVICLIVFCLFIGSFRPCNSQNHVITVDGDGVVYVVPDTLTLSLNIQETSSTTAEAQKRASDKVEQIQAILAQYNISKSDIKTTNVSVYEQFDWRDSGRVSLGYTANHSLEIKVKDINGENNGVANKILAEISEIGGILVNDMRYDIYDKTEYYRQARKLAMEKAYQKASELAEFGDVKLGKPVSIQENQSYDYGILAMKNTAISSVEEDAIEDEAGGISLGEMEIKLDVTVSYKIK